jgi:coenzyme F420-0:L-glutamate ligase / coenzyme F420-1:gamma-L-glutamate ligase
MPLTLFPINDLPMIFAGDDLAGLICAAFSRNKLKLQQGDILVLAQKIVSKAEDRFVNLTTVVPGEKAISLAKETQKDPRFIELVLKESKEVLRTRPGTIIVEHRCGFICANAGIDHSNVQGGWGNPDDWVLLLPVDADLSARKLKMRIEEITGKTIGVIIIDTHGRAWRMGTVGVAIGLSGVPGVVDLRGKTDLLGYHLKVTQVAAADELAAAASLMMGQAAENTPVVLARGFPYPFRDGSLQELIRPREMDLFR